MKKKGGKTMCKKIFPVVLSVLVFSSAAFCRTSRSGWWIFRRTQSAKSKPITAVMSVRGDLSGIFYNPSIIATMKQKELFLMTELGPVSDSFSGLTPNVFMVLG